jgi:hypothetical protein
MLAVSRDTSLSLSLPPSLFSRQFSQRPGVTACAVTLLLLHSAEPVVLDMWGRQPVTCPSASRSPSLLAALNLRIHRPTWAVRIPGFLKRAMNLGISTPGSVRGNVRATSCWGASNTKTPAYGLVSCVPSKLSAMVASQQAFTSPLPLRSLSGGYRILLVCRSAPATAPTRVLWPLKQEHRRPRRTTRMGTWSTIRF